MLAAREALVSKRVGGFKRQADEIIEGELALTPELVPIFEAVMQARRDMLARIAALDRQIRAEPGTQYEAKRDQPLKKASRKLQEKASLASSVPHITSPHKSPLRVNHVLKPSRILKQRARLIKSCNGVDKS